jgi:hypothetical protein
MRPWRIFALLCLATPAWPAPPPASGRWQGVVHIPERDAVVVVDLAQDDHGAWTGSAILPDFGVKGAPLGALNVTAAEVGFTLEALGTPRFSGRLAADGTLSGTFQQAGNTAPFELRRTGPAQVDMPLRSTEIAKAFDGVWSGQTELLGNPLRVRLTLQSPNGVQFFVAGHREHDLKVDLVAQDGAFLSVRSSDLGGIRFEGELRSADHRIVGSLNQGPFEAPLVLVPGAEGGQR